MGRAVGGNFQGMYVGRGGNVEQKFGGGGGCVFVEMEIHSEGDEG